MRSGHRALDAPHRSNDARLSYDTSGGFPAMSRISAARRGRPVLATAALAAVLALAATACMGDEDAVNNADSKPAASESAQDTGGSKDKIGIPDKMPKDLPTSLQDLDKWKSGAWKNWDKDQWVREAKDFVNPYLKGHWDLGR